MAELERVQTIRKFEMAVSKFERLHIMANGALAYGVKRMFDDIKWIFYIQDRK